GDGSETVPAPGWWKGIYIYDGGSATLDNCVVRYGGHFHSSHLHNTRANILKVGAGDLTVTNSIISHNSNDGIRLQNTTGTVTINDSDFIANQRDGISSDNSTPVISGNTVSNNSRYGLYVDGNAIPAQVNGNTLDGNETADLCLTANASGTFVAANNSFGGGIRILAGAINGDTEWKSPHPYYIRGHVSVPAETTLSVSDTPAVKFAESRALAVYGTLDAQGTSTDKLYFTDYRDDEAGGDTN
ncbi:right-handed parallel beta-helix repeat-containing protein, partial [Dethiobacter alkaliphilus]|uniref:right-handed parallel beta-helix repeat-containing protein n=1 Tax=Dethiobacter alkaliphilus TaxID=427926 RepID=UPI0022265DDF